jgi:hypothetical protein
MNYTTTTVKTVIAKIIRSTGKNLPSEYIEDILEYVPEGIKKLKTKMNVVPLTKVIEVKDHIGALPCGLLSINAIEYCGHRLREGGDIRDIKQTEDAFLSGTNTTDLWENDTSEDKDYSSESYPDNSYVEEVRGQDIVRSPADSEAAFYKLVPNYIHTSFECGEITVHGNQLPLDEEGYPLIPDNENYKEALYWYVLTKLIESGYKHHLFDWNHCWNMFEKVYARRAINEIKYPNPDRVEKLYRAFIRLVPPEHFYDDFRSGSEQIQPIKGL